MQCGNRIGRLERQICHRMRSHRALLGSSKESHHGSNNVIPRFHLNTLERVRKISFSSVSKNTAPKLWRHDTTNDEDATIFALSTAPGKAAIAVVRCSGPACPQIYHALCPNKPFPTERKATLRKLYSPRSSASASPELLDPGALILFFPAPNTVTGEPVLELHLHGGNATVRAVLSSISSISTPTAPIRPAEPGEFTRRAFYNQRLDLTQIESLGDTLAAETEQQRQLAVRGSGRVLANRYESWRNQLLAARGELEALIDFSEDQHFDESPAQLAGSVAEKVKVLLSQIDASRKNAARGELLRNGIRVALLGAPNVGKSSLLNRIVGREAAIVSPEAGTTRDVVETNVDIGGFFCNFGDLAGVRDKATALTGTGANGASANSEIGDVEKEGIRRAKARALEADVVVVVRAVERDAEGKLIIPLPDEVAETLKKCDFRRQGVVQVINKIDLAGNSIPDNHRQLEKLLDDNASPVSPESTIFVSCHTNTSNSNVAPERGIQDLLNLLITTFSSLTKDIAIPGIASSSTTDASLGASERQARLLESCQTELQLFLDAVDVEIPEGGLDEEETDVDIVVAAESLRAAADALAKITGRGESGDVEDVLGVVFENFCVGK